ncbi:MAG: transposase [Methylococcales bacterium]|nr:transposase [Methylococcales bacterium]
MTFVHRFGSALNVHIHFHCCVIDGVFSAEGEALRFHPAIVTREVVAKVQAEVRERVLRLFKRRALLSPEAVNAMREWGHEGGFSLNADITVAAWDRVGLERLLCYCTRPIFASKRLHWIEKDQRLVYHLPKPRPDGQTVLYLTPLAFLDKLAVLIPPPRKHRHRYHGVLAPNAPLCQAVTAYAGLPLGDEAVLADQAPVTHEDRSEAGAKMPFYAVSLWAMLIARIYEVLPLVCPQCGGELKIVAFLTETVPIQRILIHIGEPATPPRIDPARAPPDWPNADIDKTAPNESETAEPIPEFEFDQTMSW